MTSRIRQQRQQQQQEIITGQTQVTIVNTRESRSIRSIQLPTELWIGIGSHLQQWPKDLMHLASASRAFRTLFQHETYRVIQINKYDHTDPMGTRMDLANARKVQALCRSIKIPRLGDHVTSFRIFENSSWNCLGDFCRDPNMCTCRNGWDKDLGDAIAHLPNLQTLAFYCKKSHSNDLSDLHPWLANLQTQQLRQLEFGCNARFGHHDSRWTFDQFAWLYAPCMKKLVALKLAVRNATVDGFHRFLLLHPDMLSYKIETVEYPERQVLNWLALNRSMKRLVYGLNETLWSLGESGPTTTFIEHGNSKIELLYAQNIHYWLSGQDPLLYRNLRYIGSISLEAVGLSTMAVSAIISSLSFLPRLNFIEFCIRSVLSPRLPAP
ncbi:hypothetical protein FRC14_003098, partial [Serendipita sp. 396]